MKKFGWLALLMFPIGIHGAPIDDWAKMEGLRPYAYYLPFQSNVPVGTLHFLIQADENGVANIIFPTAGAFTVSLELVATATPSPKPPTPTPTPTITWTPTATPTATPTPTRPNSLRPGSWGDLLERLKELWEAQKTWDETFGD